MLHPFVASSFMLVAGLAALAGAASAGELGFVAWSQVAVPGQPAKGSTWQVPPSLYGEIRQDTVLVKAGEKNPAAAALLGYLKGDAAKAVIQSHGYGLK